MERCRRTNEKYTYHKERFAGSLIQLNGAEEVVRTSNRETGRQIGKGQRDTGYMEYNKNYKRSNMYAEATKQRVQSSDTNGVNYWYEVTAGWGRFPWWKMASSTCLSFSLLTR